MSDHDPADAAATPAHGGLFDGPAAPAAETLAPTVQHVTVRRGGTPLLLSLVLFAGLAGAGYYGWTHPAPGVQAGGTDDEAGLGQQVQALTARVAALERQGAAAGSQAGDAMEQMSRKVDALGGKVGDLVTRQEQLAAQEGKLAEAQSQAQAASQAAPPPAAPDNTAQQVSGLIAGQQAADARAIDEKLQSGLSAQKTALDQSLADQRTQIDQAVAKAAAEQKAAVHQAAAEDKTARDALDQRLGKLEQAAQSNTAAQDEASRQASLTAALDALGGRLAKLEQGEGAAQAADAQDHKALAGDDAAIQTLDQRVDKLDHGQSQDAGAAQQAARAIRIAAAEAALQAGQPLGTLDGAPAALTRFATVAPPTEGALRAQFPAVADAARAASQPSTANRSFLDRALARVQQSVVVRRGDRVLVGDPAAGVLARAQAFVSAGDLKGAVDALGALQGSAAQAMSAWRAQAQSLVDARAALASLSAHG